MNPQLQVGIQAISVHIPQHYLSLADLARANKIDPAKYTLGLGCHQMAIVGPDEDPVTMAYEAANNLLQRYEVDPADIGQLVVGTETGIDEAKPIAAYLHRLLELPSNCRTFDTKHACYGSTAALRSAIDWVIARAHTGNRKALVIATDIARYEIGSAGEPTQGAGAVAMLVSTQPDILILEPYPEAVYTQEVMDFWRPLYSDTARVDGHASIAAYLKALEETWSEYGHDSELEWDDYNYFLFHVPFPKMAYKAFKRLYELERAKRNGSAHKLTPMEQAFQNRTWPALWANRKLGNIYSGSLYLSLAGLLEREDDDAVGTRVGLFSYGSGSCAEFFSGRVGSDAKAWRGRIGIEHGLRKRLELNHAEYLGFRQACTEMADNGSCIQVLEPEEDSPGKLAYCGIQDHQRVYGFARRADVVYHQRPTQVEQSRKTWQSFGQKPEAIEPLIGDRAR